MIPWLGDEAVFPPDEQALREALYQAACATAGGEKLALVLGEEGFGEGLAPHSVAASRSASRSIG